MMMVMMMIQGSLVYMTQRIGRVFQYEHMKLLMKPAHSAGYPPLVWDYVLYGNIGASLSET